MRTFLFGAAAALAVLGLGCGSSTLSGSIRIDRALQALIRPDAVVLAGIDLAALQTTGFYRRYAQRLDLPGLNDASERLGFDPRRDVKTLLFEYDGDRSIILARGTLQAAQIRQKLTAQGAHSTGYRSFSLFGDERNSIAILDNAVAVAGPVPAVKSTLDRSEDKSGSIPAALQVRLETVAKGSQIWVVSSKGLPFGEMSMRSDVQSALSNILAYISGATAGLHVDDGLDLNATLTCVSAAGAQRVHDALRGAIGLGRLSTKDDQTELLKLYDAIEVNQVGSVVAVKAKIDAAEADKLVTYLPQIKTRTGQVAQ